jgi:hypothetical protein
VDKGMFGTVEHRKLMMLKNCGILEIERLEQLANQVFISLRYKIKDERLLKQENKSWLDKLLTFGAYPISQEVDIMFSNRDELVNHISEIVVPSELCPISQEDKDELILVDRAVRYVKEAEKILDMFKRHHEVIVDSDHSVVVEWVIQNAPNIRNLLNERGI